MGKGGGKRDDDEFRLGGVRARRGGTGFRPSTQVEPSRQVASARGRGSLTPRKRLNESCDCVRDGQDAEEPAVPMTGRQEISKKRRTSLLREAERRRWILLGVRLAARVPDKGRDEK